MAHNPYILSLTQINKSIKKSCHQNPKLLYQCLHPTSNLCKENKILHGMSIYENIYTQCVLDLYFNFRSLSFLSCFLFSDLTQFGFGFINFGSSLKFKSSYTLMTKYKIHKPSIYPCIPNSPSQ